MEYSFKSLHFSYRLIVPADSKEFVSIYTNELLMRHISAPLSETEAAALFNRFLKFNIARPQKHYLFAIEDRESKNPLGFCGANTKRNESNPQIKTGEIGVILMETATGNGAGTEAMNALVSHCFQELSYEKLIGPPSLNNIASIKMLEKAGFKKETVLKDHLTINGEQIDTPLYVIYNSD